MHEAGQGVRSMVGGGVRSMGRGWGFTRAPVTEKIACDMRIQSQQCIQVSLLAFKGFNRGRCGLLLPRFGPINPAMD